MSWDTGTFSFPSLGSGDEDSWLFADPVGTGVQSEGTTRRWCWSQDDTPSTNVGPTTGQGGSPEGYLYTEASNPGAQGDEFTMEFNEDMGDGTGILDCATYEVVFTFYTNQRGTDNEAWCYVQTNENGAGWSTIATFGGPDDPNKVATGGSQIWASRSINLTEEGVTDASTRVRIMVVLNSSGNIWHCDYGIDTVQLVATAMAGITSIDSDYGDGSNEFDLDENSLDVNGLSFGASQGSGTVYISDANTLAGSANEVEIANAINTWSNTVINLNMTSCNSTELGNLETLGPGMRYIIVVTDGTDEYGSPALVAHRAKAFSLSASDNIDPSGENTTPQLVAPATKDTGDFGGGRIQDDENPSDTIDLDADEYGEWEWSIEANTPSDGTYLGAQSDETYQFRVLFDDDVVETYSVTPELTIAISAVTHDPPTNLECDHQSSPATNVSEAPVFSAIFNDAASGHAAEWAYVQVATTDTFDSGTVLYDSDWVALASSGHGDGERTQLVTYGDGDSAAEMLVSFTTYYWRIKLKDESDNESEWSDYTSSEPSQFSGIRRAWALPNYPFRHKLLIDTTYDHPEIPAGWDISFDIKTGERVKATDNGCFNEAIQASGGYQIDGFEGTLYMIYLSEPDPTDPSGDYAIYIVESTDNGETWSDPQYVTDSRSNYDTHYFPVLCTDKAGYIHVVYGAHGGDFRYTHSTYSADITAWETPTTVTDMQGTYPVLINVPTKGSPTYGRTYLFFRDNISYIASFMYTDDHGDSWSQDYEYIEDESAAKNRVYCYGMRYDLTTQRLHVTYTFEWSSLNERGIWYLYSDLDEVDSVSADVGFNIWHRADGTVVGYTQPSSGTIVGYDVTDAIDLSALSYTRIFVETLELDAFGNPIVFWEQRLYSDGFASETYLVCATWSGSAWEIHYITDQTQRMLRVRRSSISCQRDQDGIIHVFIPVRGRTWSHFLPTGDISLQGITTKDGGDAYVEIDDGFTEEDEEGSYFDIAATVGNHALFSSTTSMETGTREIFTVEVQAIVRRDVISSTIRLYLDDGTTTDYSSNIAVSLNTYHKVSATWDINPFNSSGIWTESDIDSLRFGIDLQAAATVRVTRMFMRAQYTKNSDADYGSTEIHELTSADHGVTWSFAREVTRNSSVGVPIMNHAHRLINNQIHIIWTSGFDIFYLSDTRYGLFNFTGEDLRIIYAGQEIDRVLDYANLNTTRVTYPLQEAIPANAQVGPDDYYAYFGYRDETSAPLSNPHNVWPRGFHNVEEYNDGDDLDGQGGWSVNSAGSATAYQSPPDHANKVGAGELSVELTGGTEYEKTIGSDLDDVEIEIFIWQEDSGGKTYLEIEDSGGATFGAGLDSAANRAVYHLDDSWTNSNLIAAIKSYNRLRIVATPPGCSAWWNDNLIVWGASSSAASITTVDIVRFVAASLSYFDFMRVGYSWEALKNNTISQGSITDYTMLLNSTRTAPYNATYDAKQDLGLYEIRKIEITIRARDDALSVPGAALFAIHISNAGTYDDSAIDRSIGMGVPSYGNAPGVYISAASTWYYKTFILDYEATVDDSFVYDSGNDDETYIMPTLGPHSIKIDLFDHEIEAPQAELYEIIWHYDATDPIVIIDSLEAQGYALGAAIQGRGLVSVYLGGTIGGYLVGLTAGGVDVSAATPTIILGSIATTPASAALQLTSLSPTVIKGSITIAPASSGLDIAAVTPSVILSSISLIPSSAAIDLSATTPTVIKGSVSVSPAPASLMLTAVNPIVIKGSLTVTPASAIITLGAINPTIVKGSISSEPAAAKITLSAVSPSVVQPSITVSPTASATELTASSPIVIKGSIIVSPSSAALYLSATSPTVVFGSISLAPDTAGIDLTASNPTVIKGSLSIDLVSGVVAISGTSPTVTIGAVNVQPQAVELNIGAASPTVIKGSITTAPTTAAIDIGAENPSVVKGDISITPTSAVVVLGAASPTTLLGSVSVQPTSAVCDLDTTSPSIVKGAIIYTPSSADTDIAATVGDIFLNSTTATPVSAGADITAQSPSVSAGALIVSPSAASLNITAISPTTVQTSLSLIPTVAQTDLAASNPTTIQASLTLGPISAATTISAASPQAIAGDITVQPSIAALSINASSPSVIKGDINITAVAAYTLIDAIGPGILLTSTMAFPESAATDISAISPSVSAGALLVSPTSATFDLSALSPTIVQPSVTVTPTAATLALGATDPSVIQASIQITSAAAICDVTAINPAVSAGALIISPSAASLAIGAANPNVVQPSIAITPATAALDLSAVEPSVIQPSLQITPAAAVLELGATNPNVSVGGLSLLPPAAMMDITASSPVVVRGTISLTPTSAETRILAIDPSVLQPSIQIAPSSAGVDLSAISPTTIVDALQVAPAAAAMLVTGVDPTAILGTIQISPTATVVEISGSDPVLILGSMTLTPEAMATLVTAAEPVIIVPTGLVVSPTASEFVLLAITPNVIYGTVLASPAPAITAVSTTNPTVITTGIILTPKRTVNIFRDNRLIDVYREDRLGGIVREDRTIDIKSE